MVIHAHMLICLRITMLTCSHAHMPYRSLCSYAHMLYYCLCISLYLPRVHVKYTSIKLTPAFAELWFGTLSKCRLGSGIRGGRTWSSSFVDSPRGLRLFWTLVMLSYDCMYLFWFAFR